VCRYESMSGKRRFYGRMVQPSGHYRLEPVKESIEILTMVDDPDVGNVSILGGKYVYLSIRVLLE